MILAPVSLKELAAEAGVSRVTASRALNNDKRVKAETREQLRILAHRIGYRPNAAARALKKNLVQHVGLALTSVEAVSYSGYVLRDYTYFIPKLGELLDQAGLNLMVANVSRLMNPESMYDSLPPMIEYNHISSLVVLGNTWPELAKLIKRFRIFCIVVDGDSCGMPAVCRDEEAAAESLLDHLYELGHRRIAYWSPVDFGAGASQRSHVWPLGYAKAMTRHQLPAVPGWDKAMNERQAAEFFLEREDPPTAIIAYDDEDAGRLMGTLAKRGVTVPEQMSLVALRDKGNANVYSPSLTVVASPFDEMAEQLSKWLIKESSRPRNAEEMEVIIPGRVAVGGSSGPPPSGIQQ